MKPCEYAEFIMVLSSAAPARLSCFAALELYRGRWLVELAFKRLKSLLDAGHVPKESDASARSWMQAKILSALLIDRTLWEGEFTTGLLLYFLPGAHEMTDMPDINAA